MKCFLEQVKKTIIYFDRNVDVDIRAIKDLRSKLHEYFVVIDPTNAGYDLAETLYLQLMSYQHGMTPYDLENIKDLYRELLYESNQR